MGVVSPRGLEGDTVARFRQQARGHVAPGDSPGHADGWGIVYYDDKGRPAYAGRSTRDALDDPLYDQAVGELRKIRPKGPLLAHVRKASAGALSIDNTHPFTHGRWSFCHNGTVWGFAPEGQSDSRALFAALMTNIERTGNVVSAMSRLVDEVGCLDFTSLTCLLSDGKTMWGLRKVGNVDEQCHQNACSPDYYTLGFARVGEHTVVSQEHEFLGIPEWRVVPDGRVVVVDAHGQAHVTPL